MSNKTKLIFHNDGYSFMKCKRILASSSVYGRRRQYPLTFQLHCLLLSLSILINWLIDWCLTPTLAVFQLYRGVNKFYYLLRHLQDTNTCIFTSKKSLIIPKRYNQNAINRRKDNIRVTIPHLPSTYILTYILYIYFQKIPSTIVYFF